MFGLLQVVNLFHSDTVLTCRHFRQDQLAIAGLFQKRQPGLSVEVGRGSRTRTVSGAAALFASRSKLKLMKRPGEEVKAGKTKQHLDFRDQ